MTDRRRETIAATLWGMDTASTYKCADAIIKALDGLDRPGWHVRSVSRETGRFRLSVSIATADGGGVPGRHYWFAYRGNTYDVVAQGDEATLDEAQAAAEKAAEGAVEP